MFYTFKSRGSFVAAFYTQDAQQFSCLWQSFYGQRTFLKERDAILSEKEEDE